MNTKCVKHIYIEVVLLFHYYLNSVCFIGFVAYFIYIILLQLYIVSCASL